MRERSNLSADLRFGFDLRSRRKARYPTRSHAQANWERYLVCPARDCTWSCGALPITRGLGV